MKRIPTTQEILDEGNGNDIEVIDSYSNFEIIVVDLKDW